MATFFVAKVLVLEPDLGEAADSVLGFGPGLAVGAGGCLELTEEGLAGLALGLVEDTVAAIGFVVFFFGASLAVLSDDGLDPSLLSFLGEAGFFDNDPFLGTWFSVVALPLESALITPVVAFSAAPVLTLLVSLVPVLFVELLLFAESTF